MFLNVSTFFRIRQTKDAAQMRRAADEEISRTENTEENTEENIEENIEEEEESKEKVERKKKKDKRFAYVKKKQ